MSSEILKPLIPFCNYNWQEDKIATVLHKGYDKDGIPLIPVIIDIR